MERSLRGMKIGTHSLETESGVAFADRREEKYVCTEGHTFYVTFSEDAEAPFTWECKCGEKAECVGGTEDDDDKKPAKPARTHWDMILERRNEEQLQEILDERLALLRSGKFYKRRR